MRLHTTSAHILKRHSNRFLTHTRAHTAPGHAKRPFFAQESPGPPCNRKSQKSSDQRPSKRPPRQQSMAAGWSIGAASSARKNRRVFDPARRRLKQALVSQGLAHWERGWGVAEGRFALWVGCAVGSGGWLGPGSTLYCCPLGVQELLGPRRQVQPARARSKTGCRISDRVARGCWEGARAPPYPQTCPVSALPRFPQPHRPPWARVIEAYRRANLHAATFNPARGASVQHDLLQQAGPPIHACAAISAPSQKSGGPAATTAHRAPTPKSTLASPGCAHPPQERRCGPAPSTVRSGVAEGVGCKMEAAV